MVDRADLGTHTFANSRETDQHVQTWVWEIRKEIHIPCADAAHQPMDLSASLPLVKSYLESGKENAPADALG